MQGQHDHFTPWEGESDESGDSDKRLPLVFTPVAPVYTFGNVEMFARRHHSGTLQEFKYESLTVRRFNRDAHGFKAWPMMVLRDTVPLPGDKGSGADLLFFVEPCKGDAMLPKEDEVCGMDIPRFGLRQATKRENPCPSWRIWHEFWRRCLVFEVTLPYERQKPKGFTSISPLLEGPHSIQSNMAMPGPSPEACTVVSFQLRLSTSTRDAELNALHFLMKSRASETKNAALCNRIRAFEYTMRFRNPTKATLLFGPFPHMRDPILKPKDMPPKLVERFQKMNSNQIGAYKTLLSYIPDRVCVLPGGPGAGYDI